MKFEVLLSSPAGPLAIITGYREMKKGESEMAGEQSAMLRGLLEGGVGEESEQAARNLTCLRLLRDTTESFDCFMAACVRMYMHTVCDVTKMLTKEKGETQVNEEEKKPTIEELEKAIGTLDEPEIMPDGSIRGGRAWLERHRQAKTEPGVGSDDFKEDCFALRARIEETKIQTMLVFKEHPVFQVDASDPNVPLLRPEQFGEMRANLKLAFRHLEDARMRLGKAIQAFDGGKSCYPR